MKAIYLFTLLISFKLFSAEGVIMLAGGGPEGDIGVKSDWSYPLYKKLIENGDTNGDKKIKVVVISLKKPDSNFMVDYLKSMGADTSENLVVSSRKIANDPKLMKKIKEADVVFFRGGNQGEAYQKWKDTLLHKEIRALVERKGAIGGTSSGTMALAEYSITGGKDFSSSDVLSDAHSDLLNDEIKTDTSGIHNDFLNVAENLIVDTHCGERARIGRIMAVMAKATDDFQKKNITGLCLEEKTGVIIQNGKARVYGTGLAHFLTETDQTEKDRRANHPLSYTNVRLDALTEGWTYNLNTRSPETDLAPKNAQHLELKIPCGEVQPNFNLKSSISKTLNFFEPNESEFLSVGMDAYSEEKMDSGDKRKGAIQTRAFNEMAKDPRKSVILIDHSTTIANPAKNILAFHSSEKTPAMILDCKECSHSSSSSFISTQDDGSNTLYSKGFVNMRVHIIGETSLYDLSEHRAMLVNKEINADGSCILRPVTSFSSLAASEREITKKIACKK